MIDLKLLETDFEYIVKKLESKKVSKVELVALKNIYSELKQSKKQLEDAQAQHKAMSELIGKCKQEISKFKDLAEDKNIIAIENVNSDLLDTIQLLLSEYNFKKLEISYKIHEIDCRYVDHRNQVWILLNHNSKDLSDSAIPIRKAITDKIVFFYIPNQDDVIDYDKIQSVFTFAQERLSKLVVDEEI